MRFKGFYYTKKSGSVTAFKNFGGPPYSEGSLNEVLKVSFTFSEIEKIHETSFEPTQTNVGNISFLRLASKTVRALIVDILIKALTFIFLRPFTFYEKKPVRLL